MKLLKILKTGTYKTSDGRQLPLSRGSSIRLSDKLAQRLADEGWGDLIEVTLHPHLNDHDIWLNVNDVVHRTGISKSTIDRAISEEKLRVGGTIGKRLFKLSWIDNWLAE